MDKKGKVGASMIVTGVIAAVVLFYMVQALYPTMDNSLGNLSDIGNDSGIPIMRTLFTTGGIVAILLVIGVFYAAYQIWMVKR